MMKIYSKVLFLALALIFTSNASAKILPVSLGVKGGLNVSEFSTKEDKTKLGFHAGLTANVSLLGLHILSGVEYTTKGAKYDIEGKNYSMNANYIQVPIHLGYKLSLPIVSISIDAGPYAAYGVGGKYENEDGKHKVFDGKTYKKHDWGLGAGIGIELFGRYGVRAGYDWGLQNINKLKGDDAEKIRTRNLSISLIHKFF